MRKLFIALMMISCGTIMAQQIDSTSIGESLKKIGASANKTTNEPAQKPKYEKTQWFTIGAKLGYNLSLAQDKIEERYTLHSSLRHGGTTGIYMRLGTNVYCQPEVLYTFSIYDEKRDFSGDTLSRDLQNHTIDLPVLLGYSPVCNENFKLRIMAGPRFAFNVNKREKYNAIQPNRDDITASMSKARLGLDCGIGFDFWRVTLDIRYILMQDIYKYQCLDKEDNEWKRINFLISTFSFTIGYNIWGDNKPSPKRQKFVDK